MPAVSIVWFRDDLRLGDNAALSLASEGPCLPVFVLDDATGRRLGGAARWWLDKSLRALDADLRAIGSRLTLARGDAATALVALAAAVGADQVVFNRRWDVDGLTGQGAAERELKAAGLRTVCIDDSLLYPFDALGGRPYRVYSAFWRAVRSLEPPPRPRPAPTRLQSPAASPTGLTIEALGLHPSSPDWSGGFSDWRPGEAGAAARLARFLDRSRRYASLRDYPSSDAGSRLSAHLRFGEISPRQVFWAAYGRPDLSDADREKFLSELGWREFNWRLLAAAPDLADRNVQSRFDAFPWVKDPSAARAWRRGETGYPIVDAGMRELWTTGFMHNRVRMIAASFLAKHLLIDWRVGERHFWDALVDADAANNPANWQWVAGCGADAAPYFRIFNPTLQGKKFDPDGAYVRQWVPELAQMPADAIHEPWKAGLLRPGTYPGPIVGHEFARARALAAFQSLRSA